MQEICRKPSAKSKCVVHIVVIELVILVKKAIGIKFLWILVFARISCHSPMNAFDPRPHTSLRSS